MITTILMDVDNTLLDFNVCAQQSIEGACNEAGITYTDDMYHAFMDVNQMLWNRIEKGTLTRAQLYAMRWNLVFERIGLGMPGDVFEKAYSARLATSHYPVDGARDILTYLSAKYTLCVASNAPYERQSDRLRRAGFLPYFAHVFVSEDLGFYKPSRSFFDACFDRLGNIKKENVVLIGDSLTADVAGGRDYGIKTCWFRYDKASLPADAQADYAVGALAEIKDIL